MKIIGITEEPDVLLSDNQRLREQTYYSLDWNQTAPAKKEKM